jgi:2',3'-cyclic-nucleotide 2'-phosphodiesterase
MNSMIKILMLGDVVGRPGRDIIRKWVPELREKEAIDLVIANGENVAGGRGLTSDTASDLFSSGVDVLTNGDHSWDKQEFSQLVQNNKRVIRPANYPEDCPGKGYSVVEAAGHSVGILNLCGRVFMAPSFQCPFQTANKILETLKSQCKIILVDMHAEATSEKIAMGWYLDGRVSAVVGSHTHVQTADERILPKGTAYLTDMGMTGPYQSVIGREIEPVLNRFITQMPHRFHVAKEDARLMGALIEVNPDDGRALHIQRVQKK